MITYYMSLSSHFIIESNLESGPIYIKAPYPGGL